MAMNITDDDQLAHILKFYHRPIYREVTDYYAALDTIEEITTNNTTIYQFTLPFQNVYLDEDGYAVTYNEQRVEDNQVEYKNESDEYYEYIAPLEWKKTTLPGSPYWDTEEEEETP